MKDEELIAPCGMNCGICKAYHREKNTCPGCRENHPNEPVNRSKCIIKNCEDMKKNNWKYCTKCSKLPCKRMKQLDKRYTTNYNMSMLENLKFIKDKGMDAFLEKEKKKWTCPECGGIVTCHGGICLDCGFVKFKN